MQNQPLSISGDEPEGIEMFAALLSAVAEKDARSAIELNQIFGEAQTWPFTIYRQGRVGHSGETDWVNQLELWTGDYTQLERVKDMRLLIEYAADETGIDEVIVRDWQSRLT